MVQLAPPTKWPAHPLDRAAGDPSSTTTATTLVIEDGKPLVPTWYVPFQVVLGLVFIALFLVGAGSSDTVAWYQWWNLVSGFLILGIAVYEAIRARQRGRRW